MAVWKEFKCAAHGEFEGVEPICPHGCSARFVTREIRSAPGIRGDRTKAADWAINALAEDFGYTDIQNSPSRTNSVAEFATKNGKLIKAAPSWGEVQHAAPGWSQKGAKAEVPIVRGANFGTVEDSAPNKVLASRQGFGIPTKQVLKPKEGTG